MTRNSWYYLVILLALAIGGEKILSLSRQNSELQSQNQDLQGQIANLHAQLIKEHMKDQTEFFAAQTAVEQLQAQVKAQKDQLANAAQRLQAEKNGGAGGKQLPGLRDKLNQEKQLIADLEQRLRDTRAQEANLRNQDKYYLQQAGVTQKQTDEQLKSQIAEQQQTLRQMVEQAKAYRQNSVFNPDYAQKYSALQARIEVQRNTIQQLKNQRSAVAAQWGYQKNSSHSQNQQDLGSLQTTERDLQEQLNRERATLKTMSQDVQSGVQSQRSQESLIQTAQADYNKQKAKLQDLERQLEQAQAHMAQVSPPGTTQAASPTPEQE